VCVVVDSHSGSHDSVSSKSEDMTLCVGRAKELGLVEGQVVRVDDQHFVRTGSLCFLGAPKIGKTTLLQQARLQMLESHVGDKHCTCPVFVSWRDGAHGPRWTDSVLPQINDYVFRTRWADGAAVPVVQQHRDAGPETRGQLFEDLQLVSTERSPLRIVFLLDDLDVALQTRDGAWEPELVSPSEFLEFAGHWPKTVKLVATSRDYLRVSNRHRALFRHESWLRLLTEKHAHDLARLLLDSADDKTLASVIEWAGHHPYYISTLCHAIGVTAASEQRMSPSTVERATYWWRASQEIEDHLNGSWHYLRLGHDVRRMIVLRRLLSDDELEEEQSPPLEDAIRFLADRAVVWIRMSNGHRTVRMPSRLLREFMRTRVSSQKHEQEWSRAEIIFLQLSIVAMFLTFFSMFLVYLLGPATMAKWAVAWFMLPLAYLCWRGLFRRAGVWMVGWMMKLRLTQR
jgi:hypothetical protein